MCIRDSFKDSGGKDSVKMDMAEILKQEGFYSSIDEITAHMLGESWITATDARHVVKITHWGTAEAKKTISNAPDNSRELKKDSKRLISAAKEFVVMMEEFADEPTRPRFTLIEKRCAELGELVSRVKANMD